MSHNPKNLRDALRKKGIEFGGHLILAKSQKPAVNVKPFTKNVKSTLVPHVAKIQTEMGIQEDHLPFGHFGRPVNVARKVHIRMAKRVTHPQICTVFQVI
jgi:hypothetical protein